MSPTNPGLDGVLDSQDRYALTSANEFDSESSEGEYAASDEDFDDDDDAFEREAMAVLNLRKELGEYLHRPRVKSNAVIAHIAAYPPAGVTVGRRFPLRRYPSELLAEIFLRYILSLYEHDTGLELHRGLLMIRHVCHAWREAALQHPVQLLSSYIPLMHPGFIQDLLATSGTLPLHLCEPVPTIPTQSFGIESRKLILRHIERVQSAQLVLTEDLVDPQHCPDNIRASVSPLRSLVLSCLTPHGRMNNSRFLPNVDFPELVELSFYHGMFSCFRKQLAAPSALRRLDIQFPHTNAWSDPLSNAELLSVLRGVPLLEELILQSAGAKLEEGPPMQAEPVNLPHLRLLTLCELNLVRILPIIREVSYPTTVSSRCRYYPRLSTRLQRRYLRDSWRPFARLILLTRTGSCHIISALLAW